MVLNGIVRTVVYDAIIVCCTASKNNAGGLLNRCLERSSSEQGAVAAPLLHSRDTLTVWE
jgi:hypothetical protein